MQIYTVDSLKCSLAACWPAISTVPVWLLNYAWSLQSRLPPSGFMAVSIRSPIRFAARSSGLASRGRSGLSSAVANDRGAWRPSPCVGDVPFGAPGRPHRVSSRHWWRCRRPVHGALGEPSPQPSPIPVPARGSDFRLRCEVGEGAARARPLTGHLSLVWSGHRNRSRCRRIEATASGPWEGPRVSVCLATPTPFWGKCWGTSQALQ